jgi:transposase
MSRPRRIDPLLVQRAQETAATATSVDALRRCQAVLLPGLLGATLEQTAAALGVGRATVARLQAAFRNEKTASSKTSRTWGGRRAALLTPEEEQEFLQPWLEQARGGAVVVVSPIRAALAQRLKQPVKPSVVYRLLARHGWRKVAPDTRHPKSKPEVQEDWKKNSPKCWKPC